jgi:hypothetical protein
MISSEPSQNPSVAVGKAPVGKAPLARSRWQIASWQIASWQVIFQKLRQVIVFKIDSYLEGD